MNFFLSNDAPAAHRYKLDIVSPKAASAPIVAAAGRTSGETLPCHTAIALAERLATQAVEFPGGHAGYVFRPREFASRLREVLGASIGADRADSFRMVAGHRNHNVFSFRNFPTPCNSPTLCFSLSRLAISRAAVSELNHKRTLVYVAGSSADSRIVCRARQSWKGPAWKGPDCEKVTSRGAGTSPHMPRP